MRPSTSLATTATCSSWRRMKRRRVHDVIGLKHCCYVYYTMHSMAWARHLGHLRACLFFWLAHIESVHMGQEYDFVVLEQCWHRTVIEADPPTHCRARQPASSSAWTRAIAGTQSTFRRRSTSRTSGPPANLVFKFSCTLATLIPICWPSPFCILRPHAADQQDPPSDAVRAMSMTCCAFGLCK